MTTSRIQKLKGSAFESKNYRTNSKNKTHVANTPQKCQTSVVDKISVMTLEKWKQLLFNKPVKRPKSVKLKASPLQYIKLIEEIHKNNDNKSKQRKRRDMRRVGKFGKLDTKLMDQFQKYQITNLAKHIKNLIESAIEIDISNDRLIQMIQTSFQKPELQTIFLKKNKQKKPVSIIKTHEQIASNIKFCYLSNPTDFLFMRLKQFKANLQKKISKIDNRMLETLQRNIERFQIVPMWINLRFNKTKLKPRAKNTNIDIINKLKDYEKTHGELGMISQINRNRYQVLDRITRSLDQLARSDIVC